MSRKKEITTEDLNRALWYISRDARRINRALRLDTLYEENGYLIRENAFGEKKKLKRLNKKKKPGPSEIFSFD